MDLVFQHVQELLIHGLSSLAILDDWLFKDIQSVKAVMHNGQHCSLWTCQLEA